MKKYSAYVFCFFATMFSLFAQSFVNPDDVFYADANRWEIEGNVDSIPQIRPYSSPVIKSILEQVLQNGTENDILIAREYLRKLEYESFNLALEADAGINRKQSLLTDAEAGTVRFTGSLNLAQYIYMNYDFGVTGVMGNFNLPMYDTLAFDMADDPTVVGPISVNLNFNNLLSVGTDEMGLIAGISRSEYGQYPENSIVFDSSTFHAPFINIYINRPTWSYTQSTYILSASDNFGNGAFTEKFLNLHDVTLKFLPNLSFSYYESVVSGGKIDMQYLFPCPYMVSQAFGDFADNLQIGIGLTYSPVKRMKFTGNLYVDDLSANDVVKLKFDTKMIIAAQLTAQYVPLKSAVKRFYAEGLLVAPRMYAHSDVSTQKDGSYTYAAGTYVNYQNYTHNGECLATKIWPNSIACTVGSELEPVHNLRLSLAADFICHANVNETIEVEQAKKYLQASMNPENDETPLANCRTDGSVLNFPGFPNESESKIYNNINNYPASYTNHLPFLEQQTKQYTLQLETGVSYDFTISKSLHCTLALKNIFEYIKNDGVQNEIFKASGIKEPKDSDVQNALNAWHSAIISDTVNDFLTVSAKIRF